MASKEQFPSFSQDSENYAGDSSDKLQEQQIIYSDPEATAAYLSTLPEDARKRLEDELFAQADTDQQLDNYDREDRSEQERLAPLTAGEVDLLLRAIEAQAEADRIAAEQSDLAVGEGDNSLEAEVNRQAISFIRQRLNEGQDFDQIRLEAEEQIVAGGVDGDPIDLDIDNGPMQAAGVAAYALIDLIEQQPERARDLLDHTQF